MAASTDPSTQTLEVRIGPTETSVRTTEGRVLQVPGGWEVLPPGDAALTRRIKKDGPTWTVKTLYRRRWVSAGVWAPADRIAALRAERETEKQDPKYAKKLEAGRARREREQEAYAEDFESAVRGFLAFAPEHRELEEQMARVIAAHAVPVGSGTVARTRRISIEDRAEAATIAWMRHQTTSYDHMDIPRAKGMRREVRRMLAKRSKQLLARYRSGSGPEPGTKCPLRRALEPGRQS